MRQVIVNGVSYLGELQAKEGGGFSLLAAMKTAGNQVSKADIQRYLELENLDDLKTVEFGGAGVSYTVQDLDDEIMFALEVGELVMAQAKKVAVAKLENNEFRTGLGKK